MRTTAAVALLALAGCYYDRPNPWKTAGDEADLQEKTEEDYALLVETPFRPPQNEAPRFIDPDLEAFRDTVLINASVTLLRDLLSQSAAKLAGLQTRQADLVKQDEIQRRVQLREVNRQIKVEWLRGRLIQARLDQVGADR